nr:hypothetical protein Itr_chr03CG15780 [Ipomoea trifida]
MQLIQEVLVLVVVGSIEGSHGGSKQWQWWLDFVGDTAAEFDGENLMNAEEGGGDGGDMEAGRRCVSLTTESPWAKKFPPERERGLTVAAAEECGVFRRRSHMFERGFFFFAAFLSFDNAPLVAIPGGDDEYFAPSHDHCNC